MFLSRSIFALIAATVITTPLFANETASLTPTSTEQTAVTKTTTTESTKVDLNTATAKELMKVKGVNTARAKAIVTYRKKHGKFKSVSDLAKVKGFKRLKQEKMETIQTQLMVD